jgi:hypothetical protein
MAGIKDLRERQQQIEAERPKGGGQWYYPREGDLVFFHFLSSGEDDDPYMEVFEGHELPAQREGGFGDVKFCPKSLVATSDLPCPLCDQDIKKKDRMMIWFWIDDILRTQLKQGEQLETVFYSGRNYFKQPVNGLRLWDTSAWRESPLADIIFLGEQLGNLRASQMNLVSTGGGLDRRYKIHVVPNTGALPDEIVAQAKQEAKPVIDILREQLLGIETVRRPAPVAEISTPGTVKAYTPGAPVTSPAPASTYKPTPAAAAKAPAAMVEEAVAAVAEAIVPPPDEDVPPEELF